MSRHTVSLQERANRLYRGRPFNRYDPQTGERVELDGSKIATMGAPYDEGPNATGTYPLSTEVDPAN